MVLPVPTMEFAMDYVHWIPIALVIPWEIGKLRGQSITQWQQ
jgi:hypothetical protein